MLPIRHILLHCNDKQTQKNCSVEKNSNFENEKNENQCSSGSGSSSQEDEDDDRSLIENISKYSLISRSSFIVSRESRQKREKFTRNSASTAGVEEESKSHQNFEIPRSLTHVLAREGFALDQPIGHGTYGKVYRAVRTPEFAERESKNCRNYRSISMTYAIKVMDIGRLSWQYREKFLSREIVAMRSIAEHRNIVKFFDVFKSTTFVGGRPSDKLINIVMEYCPKGDMYEFISGRCEIEERCARRWFHQLLCAIGHIHANGFAHRDLKLENILFDADYNVKVSDFGFCLPLRAVDREDHHHHHQDRIDSSTIGTKTEQNRPQKSSKSSEKQAAAKMQKRSYTFCGSLLYCSPELILGKPYIATLNDVWSCGVILFVLLFGTYPIDGDRVRKKCANGIIRQEDDDFDYSQIEYPQTPVISEECAEVLRAILEPESRRYSVARLRELRWIAEYREQDFVANHNNSIEPNMGPISIADHIERINRPVPIARQETIDFLPTEDVVTIFK